MSSVPPCVVIVDDHRLFRSGVRRELDERVKVVGEAGSVAEAIEEIIVSDRAEDVIAVIRARARGYVTKTISGDELADAIVRVAEGDAVFSPRLAGFVLDAFPGATPVPSDPELDQLTAREREVLRHIARGYLYKEIALRLGISVKTGEAHVSAVLRRLQLSNRHQLSRWAVERQLVSCDDLEADPSPQWGNSRWRAATGRVTVCRHPSTTPVKNERAREPNGIVHDRLEAGRNVPVIETRGLTKRFGARTAIDSVDLHVPPGSAFGFLGPNGAGKTTTIRMLLGLTRATAGRMSLLGRPVPAQRA